MRTIRLCPHPTIRGYYNVRVSGRIVAAIVQPTYAIELGLKLSTADVIMALRDAGFTLVGEYRVIGTETSS